MCSMTMPRMAVTIGIPERMIWFRDRLIRTRLALLATMLATCRHQLSCIRLPINLGMGAASLEGHA